MNRYDVWYDAKVPVKAWTRGVPIEGAARAQVQQVANLPFVGPHVAVMPDVHAGIGSTVGSVIPTRGAIVPAAVGVDIGCGMVAARLTLTASELPDSLAGVRSAIEAAVPHGRTDNGGANDRGAWRDVPAHVDAAIDADADWTKTLYGRFTTLCERAPSLRRWEARVFHQAGTLGTGNHFVEVCLDEEDRVWVMLHSGSRGVGNAIGRLFIDQARALCERWFVPLPHRDLAYLPEGTPDFDAYVEAVGWAQDYAAANRDLMLRASIEALSRALGREGLVPTTEEAINCHHNYVAREHHFGENLWVTRKGAVRARRGDLGIIPGSMGTRSFIVRGKGNPESLCSCSHGAGRAMSRTEARRRFNVADHVRATEAVECRKDEGVVDETPAAYKDIDAVMAAQADLVEVVHTLRQVVCVKG